MNYGKKALVASSLVLAFSINLFADEVYTIKDKTLKEALEIISKKSNLSYIANDELLELEKTNNIENIEGTQKALDKLLQGTGLKAIIKNEAIVIVKSEVKNSSKNGNDLGQIDVLANSNDGTSKTGYLVNDTSDIGIWRGKSLQNTPYAINVMSEDLMENLQATSTDQLYNINPVMQVAWNQSQNNNGYVFLRGFRSSTSAYDGMRREKWQFTHNTNVEEYERLETITGLSGFLYGPGSIGGIMNYIPKRATSTPQYNVTLGNAGGKSGYYAHADLSAPLTQDGKLAYRLNVVNQDIDSHVEHQKVEKKVFNLALDYKVTDNLLIQGVVSDSSYRLEGQQSYWYLANGVTRPSASKIDSNKLWGQKWGYHDSDVRRYSTNILWNITDNINFRTAYMDEKVSRKRITSYNTIQDNETFNQSTINSNRNQDIYAMGFYGFLDFDFNTGDIKHQLTVGLQKSESYWDIEYSDDTNSELTLNGLEFNTPIYTTAPSSAPISLIKENQLHLISTNYTIGDSIELSPKWDLLVGASYTELEYKNKNYKKSTITPSFSIVYKPIENLSIYSSYMEGLELGGVASDEHGGYDVVNAQEAMDPLMSEQIEVGAKLTLGNILLTTAIFEIDKGLEYYDTTDITKPIFVQDGRQVHRGFEFTATGKVTDNLTAIGGFTFLDAKVKENKANPELEGKRPFDVANKFAKFYLEYKPLNNLDLSINGGINYTGSFYGDNLNTDKIPSYTLVNLGAKYTTNTTTYPLTFRLNVNNAFDKQYWVNNNYLGDRRTIHASVSMKF